ncbi:hypothetical protein C7N43_00275 [Sphingobacteriales bacterium UPWRP_1]|nr:hypothetical protein BVG80_15205 [Sphingobacteriales bacterium TSM_CSM]PSJ79097.1 hypothetical protein C7N43_00275 [Sphingobacteriales bacterium UPWRP_1]
MCILSAPAFTFPPVQYRFWILAALLTASGSAYWLLCYQTLRSNTLQIWGLFAVLFALYGGIYLLVQTPAQYRFALAAALVYRALLLFCIPNLSDDFYRFTWDGRLLLHGINPFAALPIDYVNQTLPAPPGIDCTLYEQLNSPLYYTVYPPVCQAVFYLAALLFPASTGSAVAVMKGCLLLFETGTLLLMPRLLKTLHLPEKRTLLYALNPPVVAEITGNLHFEGALIFFLLAWVYGLQVSRKTNMPALFFGLAVCSKLLPLLFLPLLPRRLGLTKTVRFTLIATLVIATCFLPFFEPKTAVALFNSTGLYFGRFEFNASIYYLLRAAGYALTGYNTIQTTGKLLAATIFAAILVLACTEKRANTKNLLQAMLFALFIYFALSTTIHPWYITTLVALCVFTPYRFAIVWSGVAVLSYAAYHTPNYTECLWLAVIEYVLVYAVLGWELQREMKICQTLKIR